MICKMDKLPSCPYGRQCYRTNPEHRVKFWHPSKTSSTESSPQAPSEIGVLKTSPIGEGFRQAPSEIDTQPERRAEDGATNSALSNLRLSNINSDLQEEDLSEEEWELDSYDGLTKECAKASEPVVHNATEYSDLGQVTTITSSFEGHRVLLMLVGIPGSGKSTFCNKLIANGAQPWLRVCQDVISKGKRGSRLQCLKHAAIALSAGKSIVIDRCNIDKLQRVEFLKLAKSTGVQAHAAVINLPVSVCIQRASKRVAHEGGLQGTNVGPIINRVARSKEPPSLNEGFVRITYCRTDEEVDKMLHEYMGLNKESLLEAGIFGAIATNSTEKAQNMKVRGSSTKYSQSSQLNSMKEALNSDTGRDDLGAMTLAFPSISTADFAFDNSKASDIIVESVSKFLENNDNSGQRLVMVDLNENSQILSLVRGKAKEKGLDFNRFITFAGDITKLRSLGGPSCNVIANASNWRLKPGGGGVNAAIYTAAGPELEKVTKLQAQTLSPGSAVLVPLPISSPLYKVEGVTHVIHVLGPNMNPQRPNCLAGDYVEGCRILRNAYSCLFESFSSLARSRLAFQSTVRDVSNNGDDVPDKKPPVNAFTVLMQAAKRKGVEDSNQKKPKIMAIGKCESSQGRETCPISSSNQFSRQATDKGDTKSILPEKPDLEAGSTFQTSMEGAFAIKTEDEDNRAGQHYGKEEKKWDGWALALYKVVLQPDHHKDTVLQVTDDVIVLSDLYPKGKKHVLVIARKLGLDSIADVCKEDIPLLQNMHRIGLNWAKHFLKEDSSLVFRLGFHADPSMRQLHMHVISQDFDSPCLKKKIHWNSFTTKFFLDSSDVIAELEGCGRLLGLGLDVEMLLKVELRCHRCCSVQPNIPRLKMHIATCHHFLTNSVQTHCITAETLAEE